MIRTRFICLLLGHKISADFNSQPSVKNHLNGVHDLVNVEYILCSVFQLTVKQTSSNSYRDFIMNRAITLSRPPIPSNLAYIVADTVGQRLVQVMSLLVHTLVFS